MANAMRTIEYVPIALMACQSVRLWWRLKKKRWQRIKDRHPRQRHPKPPRDCPHCCRGVRLETARINWDVTPYREVKSKQGRKKRYSTQSYACLNLACAYVGHTGENIHVLVHHAHRGKDKDVPYLRRQACATVFSGRKGTPLLPHSESGAGGNGSDVLNLWGMAVNKSRKIPYWSPDVYNPLQRKTPLYRCGIN